MVHNTFDKYQWLSYESTTAEIVAVNNAEIENGLVLNDTLVSAHRIKVMNGAAVPVFEGETGGALLGFAVCAPKTAVRENGEWVVK